MAKRLLPFLLFLFLLATISKLSAQVSQTFTGTGTWTCPIGVTTVTVQCWGAGGAGGGVTNNNNRSGGGGGGGAFASGTVAVSVNTVYNVTVGAGGTGSQGNGTAGGASSFNTTSIVAAGGQGGTGNITTGVGGAGGTVAASTGTTRNAGGAGANGVSNVSGGGGGGGAGTTLGGGAAVATVAGIGGITGGGAGGAGVILNGNSNPGSAVGGGGGGAKKAGNGGDGADGQVIISWIIPDEVCATAVSLTPSFSCNAMFASSTYATGSGSACGLGNGDDDLWFKFVATATTHTVTVDGAANYDAVIGAYNSCGGSQPTGGACVNATGAGGIETLTLTGLTIGNTYYIEAHDFAAGGGDFTICVTMPTVPACAGSPTITGSCASAMVMSWTAPSTASNTAASSYQLYFGTNNPPTNIINGTDLGNVLTYTPALSPSTTYYWQIVPKNFVGSAVGCSIQNFTTSSVATPTNDDPCAATSIAVNSSCSYTTFSNQCATATTVGSPPAPGCAGYLGSDVWFTISVPSSTVTFDTQSGTMTDGGMAVYRGTCGALTLIACDDNTGTGSMPQITRTDLIPGETIWIRMWENGNDNNGTFGLCAYSSCTSSPGNDLPCNATPITLGTIASGDNTCAAAVGEPGNPSCFDGSTLNTVWYSFVAPATGSVKIRTAPGSLASTQIALYSGTCGASLTQVTCNDDAPACGSTAMTISEITRTGLTAGATYYIRVDGNGTSVGTFAITVVDGSSPYPPSSGQSCSTNVSVCNATVSVGDPGYQGVGFTCDDNGSGNCTTGERGSSWYTINVSSAGTLVFSIIPNNYTAGNCFSASDYDFLVWKISGTGATTCASIASTGGASAAACNFSSYGVTGLSVTGNAPTGYPNCFDASFEPGIAVSAGDVYAVLIENYSGSTSGYTLDMSSVAAGLIDYTPPTAITWSGGANTTAYNNATNWGGCTTPSCTVDGTVSPSSSFQPNITSAMGTMTVKNLTIDPGGILTLGAGAVLKVCGNLTNNGTITASPTSTILFSDDATHTLNGNLTGGNKLGNLTITDAAGGSNCTVTANAAVEVGGTFTTSNSTSIFNLNGQNFTLGGDFNNAAAATTFTNATGTFTFNGSTAQTYSPGGTLTLNNVTMNHTGSGVTLATGGTPNLIIGAGGVLTLTNGRIITPGTQQVIVKNTTPGAVTTGNSGSYVQGNLRRSLAAGATGTFEFPVGNNAKGYQRATLNFTTAASAAPSELLARFDSWGGAWTMPGAPMFGPECATVYDQPYLDNGYWSIDVVSGTSTGLYDITLYNTNYTNAASGFSVAKSPSGAPAWALNGTCTPSPVSAVVRTGLSGFSKFSTTQASVPLPVELTSFTAVSRGTYNEVKWETVKEENFNRYELESSRDAFVYSKIYTKQGSGTNSNSLLRYSYDDYGQYAPLTYYRLKLIDNDGSSKYSAVVSVSNEAKEINTVSIYPNPASSEVNIQFVDSKTKEVHVTIKDMQGRSLIDGTYTITPDKPFITLNTSALSSGSYIVTCTSKGMNETNNRLVISK
jgi:hypothetical protein